MHELRLPDYERARPLFRRLRYHLASAAVLDGNCPGRIFVDDPTQPRSAFMLSPEGCYLAGDPGNLAFNRALNEALVHQRALGDDVHALFLVVDPERWRDRLLGILAPTVPVEMKRRHYVCHSLGYDWRAEVSGKYRVLRIDPDLLSQVGLIIPGHVSGWIKNNWGSVDRFVQGGFGFLTIGAGEVVSWSLCDCVSDNLCEIGIHTARAHRRRGLATVTAAATVEHALSHGFIAVGWHCPEDNLGSIGTAEKVGFHLERNYSAYCAFLDQQ
jgi:GNAT superfamily N-acetyltransferase